MHDPSRIQSTARGRKYARPSQPPFGRLFGRRKDGAQTRHAPIRSGFVSTIVVARGRIIGTGYVQTRQKPSLIARWEEDRKSCGRMRSDGKYSRGIKRLFQARPRKHSAAITESTNGSIRAGRIFLLNCEELFSLSVYFLTYMSVAVGVHLLKLNAHYSNWRGEKKCARIDGPIFGSHFWKDCH